MKVFLMSPQDDFNLEAEDPWNAEELVQDLELNTLFNAMAQGDRFIFDMVRKTVLTGTDDLNIIRYRQDVLKDCLNNPAIIREIYQIPIESLINKKKSWLGIFSMYYPSSILDSSNKLLQMFMTLLLRLRRIADEHSANFQSEGFRRFFAMVQQELSDDYFQRVNEHLKELKFRDGVLISAALGQGNEGTQYVLRKPPEKDPNWFKQIFTQRQPVYSFVISERDEHGMKFLGDIRDRGINLVANALAQSADHIDSFLNVLRTELAFYVGCLNLAETLASLDEPLAFPQPASAADRRHSFKDLYDICLALTMKEKVVSNTLDADHRDLVIITGANQGGKSSFLRSVGVAQMMMQSGMFVAADAFSANICQGLFTHYKRKEDASMKSGKLDEELSRMSDVVSRIHPNALVLFNESFAATNEREGSEIARQITRALLDRHIKIFFVSHLYHFTHGLFEQGLENIIFLRAGRRSGGKRTFKLSEGEPRETSYGEDIYRKVFEPGE